MSGEREAKYAEAIWGAPVGEVHRAVMAVADRELEDLRAEVAGLHLALSTVERLLREERAKVARVEALLDEWHPSDWDVKQIRAALSDSATERVDEGGSVPFPPTVVSAAEYERLLNDEDS